MWNDNHTAVDLLDYQYLIHAVEEIVLNENLIPCTIGIFGDWGSGKSSLLRMVEESLSEKEEVLTITFNGWLFEGYDEAKSVLMATILEELPKRLRTGSKIKETAKKLITRLAKRVNWMKVARTTLKYGSSFALAGPEGLGIIGLGDFLKQVSDADVEAYFKEKSEDEADYSGGTGIKEFHKDFEELLKLTNINRLIVFIDDLDRCQPDTIIDILEAVKLFLYAKQSAFVLAADERIIKLAVKDRFKDFGSDGMIERDYLEKLIQFPVKIPQLGTQEIETYINLLFAELSLRMEDAKFEELRREVIKRKREHFFEVPFDLNSAKDLMGEVPDDLRDGLVLSKQIAHILSVGLKGNPRQCKRFLNTLLLRVQMAKSLKINLQKNILAKLMLLEYFKPESFRKIFELQGNQEGQPEEIKGIELRVLTTQEEKADGENKTIPLESWIADEWLLRWLKMEPRLTGADLRPYFYFARDEMVNLVPTEGKLSKVAKEIIHGLLEKSKTISRNALNKCADLSEFDSSGILNTLIEKYNIAEKLEERKLVFRSLIGFVAVRKEHIGELIQFAERLPIKKIRSEEAVSIWQIVKGTESNKIFLVVLKKWAENLENNHLAKTAQSILNKQ